MGREKKNRGRRDTPKPMAGVDEFHWTPLRQKCGDVIDWGWDGQSIPPPVFVEWCVSMMSAPCLWHGAETGIEPPPPGTIGSMNLPPTNGPVLCRQSRDTALGNRITDEVFALRKKLDEDNAAGILVDLPAKYVTWMRKRGHDPAQAWVEQRLADLILNRGKADTTAQLMSMIHDN